MREPRIGKRTIQAQPRILSEQSWNREQDHDDDRHDAIAHARKANQHANQPNPSEECDVVPLACFNDGGNGGAMELRRDEKPEQPLPEQGAQRERMEAIRRSVVPRGCHRWYVSRSVYHLRTTSRTNVGRGWSAKT